MGEGQRMGERKNAEKVKSSLKIYYSTADIKMERIISSKLRTQKRGELNLGVCDRRNYRRRRRRVGKEEAEEGKDEQRRC